MPVYNKYLNIPMEFGGGAAVPYYKLSFLSPLSGFGPPMFHPMGPMAPPMPPPMSMRPPGQIHYPSQDPQRMGAHAAHGSRHGD